MTKKCKDCHWLGRYQSMPGYHGYCLKHKKDKNGNDEACEHIKQEERYEGKP